MKKIKHLLIMSILLGVIFCSFALMPKKVEVHAAVSGQEKTIEVTSYNQTVVVDGKTYYLPNSNRKIEFTIKATFREGDDSNLVVHYKTQDFSALASKYEYVSADNTITLSASKPTYKVTLTSKVVYYQFGDNYRAFQFVIDDVQSSDNGKVTFVNNSQVKYCAVTANYVYKTRDYNNVEVLQQFFTSYKVDAPYVSDKGNEDVGHIYSKTRTRYVDSTSLWDIGVNYVKMGFGELYIGGQISIDSSHTLDWGDDWAEFSIYNYDTLFYSTEWETHFDYDTFHVGYTGQDYSAEVHNGSKIISSINRTYSKYVMVPYVSGSCEYCFVYDWEDACKLEWYDPSFEHQLIDTTAPTITYWSIVDKDLTIEDTLSICVRFSEPLHVSGTPYLTCSMQPLFGVGVDDNKKFSLKYVGGSGTDTLVFSCPCSDLATDFTKGYVLQQIYPCALTQDKNKTIAAKICDFGINGNFEQNYVKLYDDQAVTGSSFGNEDAAALGCPLKITLDLKQPQIATTQYFNAGANKSNQAKITVSNASTDATVLYTWSTDSQPFNFSNKTRREIESMYETKTNNENSSSFGDNVLFITPEGLNGTYYLHIAVISKFGRKTQDLVVGTKDGDPVKFDNTAPQYEIMNDSVLEPYDEKIFNLNITDGPNGAFSGLSEVFIVYTSNYDSYVNLKTNGTIDENIISKRVFSESIHRMTYADGKYSITLNAADELIALDENEYGTYYIAFQGFDNAGNFTEIKDLNFVKYKFDRREHFQTTIHDGEGTSNIVNVPIDNLYAYDSSKQNDIVVGKKIAEEGKLSIYSITHNGEELLPDDPAATYLTFTQFCTYTSDDNEICIKTNQDLVGVYEIVFQYNVKVSDTYVFYFSNTFDKNTNNATILDETGIFINYFYQLSSPNYFYKGTDEKVNTANYGNTKYLPSFSSLSVAKKYVEFIEKQDFQLYQVPNQAWADSLNSGTLAERTLAMNESHKANVGDYYIRYKKADWVFGDITSSNWVYYFYSDSLSEISDNNLSQNLKNALASVVNTITANGSEHFLTDEELDEHGSPYLYEGQYHLENLSATTSFTGSPYRTPIEFRGDTDIYSSYINYQDTEYRLLGTYEFDYEKYTKVFYRRLGETTYTELPIFTPYLKGVIQEDQNNNVSDGVYEILELDDKGISLNQYFLDFNAPTIKVFAEVNNGSEEIPQQINAEFDGKTYSAKNFFISELLQENDARFAYVAVYRVSAVTVSLYKVIRAQDFGTEMANVEKGNYLIKVYDRSGNNYTLNIRANDTPLVLNVIPNDNYNIRIECNRLDTDIQVFQIYRDGILITSEYRSQYIFRENGEYRVFVQDWYGNTMDVTKELKRTLPDISWRYERGSTVIKYDGSKEEKGIKMYQKGAQEYDLYTNGELSLVYPMGSEYSYEFVVDDPSRAIPATSDIATGSNDKVVKISSNGENYSIKVFYTEFPDVYLIYNVIFDNTVPVVNVITNEFDFINDELAEIEEFAQTYMNDPTTFNPSLDGKSFVPKSINYTVNSDSSLAHYISNNGVIVSNLINVELHDESYVTSVDVYLNDELIYHDINELGVQPFILSRFGVYRIVASDALGNISEFNFTNSSNKQAYIEADGVVVEESKKLLGNNNFTFNVLEDGTISFLVESDGNTYYYRFEVKDGKVYRNKFVYDISSLGGIRIPDDELIYEPGGIRTYAFGSKDGLNFDFNYDDGIYKFILTSNDVDDYHVCAKYSNDKSEPFYIEGILSNKKSETKIESMGIIYQTIDKNTININGSFHFVDPSADSEIVEVIIKDFQKNTEDVIYNLEEGFTDYYYADNGIYEIITTNIYGIKSVCEVRISNEFGVYKYVTLNNGDKFVYSSEYEGTIYSNNSVTIQFAAESSKILCFKNGEEYRVDYTRDNGLTTILFDSEGSYYIEIVDEYGNIEEIEILIKLRQMSFTENILTNYNEHARLKSEGYTNQILGVDKNILSSNNIAYLSYEINGVEVVLYDHFSENHVEITDALCEKAIGNEGTGVYKVKALDIYGNEAYKSIHYRKESTLSISRTIRSNGQFEDYDLAFAVLNGCYSNNSIRFQTSSKNYEFKVDGKASELDKTLAFAQGVDKGSLDYDIYYVDEYGFEYSFKAHLYRVEVLVYADNLDQFKDIGSILTTKNNFTVSFSNEATCTYELNDVIYEYHKGDVLKRDGIYRFTVTDFAGNIATATYRKDSICEYTFVDTIGAKTLVSGDIANNERVVFRPVNSDNVYLAEVYLNGEKIEDYKDDKFIEAGHWEILINDEVGNKSYFEFYIINHPVKGLSYQTPYTYKIQSITYTTSYGGVVSMMDYVTQSDDCSSFAFGTVTDTIKTSEDGYYEVVMYSIIYGEYSIFNFTISNEKPNINLVGCNEGEETLNNITITGYNVGDTIKVYKDNKLVKTTKITSNSVKAPEITEGGDYRIEVTNEAGLSQSLEFTRIYVFNVAGSALVIIGAIAINILLFIGLVYRTKSKIDK